MTQNTAPCFCCSEIPFSECCEPVLQDHAKAVTPQMLMRSRYTAFVLKNEAHLLTTWDPSTRPKGLSLENSKVKWINLKIHPFSANTEETQTDKVKFSASYIENDTLCTLTETSTFILHSALWYYLDGVNEISREKLGRNSSCPCGSGKKFKRCCLNL